MTTGPLKGLKIVEFAGIGPGPFCAMMLADMGATVTRIDRPGGSGGAGMMTDERRDLTNRGRRSLALDLKKPEAVDIALRLVDQADAMLEGYRPGVMEKLGLGPAVCLKRNPRLGYGRMTGWGQEGPLAPAAGHDINYIALSGALHAIGDPGLPPPPPLNLVGDYGGGGMLLAFGMACALLETARSGRGQVVDAAMTDGAALLMTAIYGLNAIGKWDTARGTNILDGAAPFYGCYECADGKYVAIGSLEPKFYAALLEKTGIAPSGGGQFDTSRWPALKAELTRIFKTKTRDAWCGVMKDADLCFSPVLDLDEAPDHPHNSARNTFISADGTVQPAPAPRFSRTAATLRQRPPLAGEHSLDILRELGFREEDCHDLFTRGVAVAAG